VSRRGARAALAGWIAAALATVGIATADPGAVEDGAASAGLTVLPIPPLPLGPPPTGALPAAIRDAAIRSRHLPIGARMREVSAPMLGRPYAFDPLGEGTGIDPDPLARYDAYDCLTFV
jgi:hypothetical protein